MTKDTWLADLHSHLIPDVDDGARPLDDTLDSVSRFMTAGVRTAITTPHVDASIAFEPKRKEAWLGPVDDAWALADKALVLQLLRNDGAADAWDDFDDLEPDVVSSSYVLIIRVS